MNIVPDERILTVRFLNVLLNGKKIAHRYAKKQVGLYDDNGLHYFFKIRLNAEVKIDPQ